MFSDIDTRELKHSPYHYTPTRWICITFVSLFGISTAMHIVQAIIYRAWYMLPTAALCGALEIFGWLERLKSSSSPLKLLPYELQMTATIIGPTPLLAANFLTLGKIVNILGPKYCRVPPRIYSAVFLGCDLIALGVQGAGGVIASQAVSQKKSANNGGHIMLGGIMFQLVAILAYVCLASEFLFRYTTERPISGRRETSSRGTLTPRLKLLMGALALNTVFLVIRALYRTVELIDGFEGPIISNQLLFNVLDGAMIVLAIFIVNFAHPGMLLQGGQDIVHQERERRSDIARESPSDSEVQMKAWAS
ncbi:RTA1 like protein-domain-containing protein [Mycena capillaripes]|nr:RTA1 like protein-domain-containing protein [Mycena capillaripes]